MDFVGITQINRSFYHTWCHRPLSQSGDRFKKIRPSVCENLHVSSDVWFFHFSYSATSIAASEQLRWPPNISKIQEEKHFPWVLFSKADQSWITKSCPLSDCVCELTNPHGWFRGQNGNLSTRLSEKHSRLSGLSSDYCVHGRSGSV